MSFEKYMSFPATEIILSSLVPKEQQGIAASLTATFINYSISIGLGIAGTQEPNAGLTDALRRIRGALHSLLG
jgi:hypothetical protein